jgi:lipoate-protein ligase A
MFTFLRVPWAKTCMQVVNVAKNKITSIKTEVGRDVSVKEITAALTEGFGKAFNVKLENSELTTYESSLAEKLYKEKYATANWNLHGISKFE